MLNSNTLYVWNVNEGDIHVLTYTINQLRPGGGGTHQTYQRALPLLGVLCVQIAQRSVHFQAFNVIHSITEPV
jgi:hypothetical protein